MFESKEFQDVFLKELETLAEDLNNTVVELQEHPHAQELLDELNRILHSLKGLFATAGFHSLAEYFHKIEDLSADLKPQSVSQRHLEIFAKIADYLDGIKEAIESGNVQFDTTLLDEILKETKAREEDINIGNDFHITIKLEQDAPLKTARLLAIINRLKNVATITNIHPTLNEIEDGLHQGEVILNIRTQEDQYTIEQIISKFDDIKEYAVEPLEITLPSQVKVRQKTVTFQTIRLPIRILDEILSTLGELMTLSQEIKPLLTHAAQTPEEYGIIADFTRYLLELQEIFLSIKQIPFGAITGRFKRYVKETSVELGKKAELIVVGEEIGIDRRLIEHLIDPIIQILRNALVHGIEPPEVRRKLGKPIEGLIRIHTYIERNNIIIEISDDGQGIDFTAIQKHAEKEGIIEKNAQLTQDQLLKLIFQPKFSTLATADMIGGRGMGLSIVKERIRAIGGDVEVDTTPQRGTRFRLFIPFHALIQNALIMTAGNIKIALPFTDIQKVIPFEEIQAITLDKHTNNTPHPIGTITLNTKTTSNDTPNGSVQVPYIDLRLFFSQLQEKYHFEGAFSKNTRDSPQSSKFTSRKEDEGFYLLWQRFKTPIVLKVDQIITTQEIYIRQLPALLTKVHGLVGLTYLAHNNVAYVLDPQKILEEESKIGKKPEKILI